MTKDDLALTKKFLDEHKINILNTRVFKKDDGKFVITVSSISTEKSQKDIAFMDNKFDVNYGEFAPYLEECNMYLKEALKYCANENQEGMIKKYLEHHVDGNIDTHKDSQRFWVKDKGPVVESNLG